MTDTPSPSRSNRATHVRTTDLRAASRLAVQATLALTSLVENLHHNILRLPAPLGAASQRPTRGITGLVYRSIRGVTRLVGGSLEALLAQIESLLGPGTSASTREREAMIAALNGVLGDHLEASGNPLAIAMRPWHDGAPLALDASSLAHALPAARGAVLLMIHGLCMNPLQWQRRRADGTRFDLGAALAADGGFTPLYLHYNSGLHVSANGLRLADLLEALQAAWPVPLEELTIVGHSMGGLVARSAVHQAVARGDQWPLRLKSIVFLGTPHHGAPLERGGQWVHKILGASPYTAAFARLARLRSAGITDLRHGSVLDDDWKGRDRFARGAGGRHPLPLPLDVACYAIAASPAAKAREDGRGVRGDGLVPVASALGLHADPRLALAIPASHRWIATSTGHIDLLSSPAVYARLRGWLAGPPDAGGPMRVPSR